MLNEPALLILLTSFLLCCPVSPHADEEEIAEFTEMQKAAERQHSILERRTQVAGERVKLVRQARSSLKKLRELDGQLESGDVDEEKIEGKFSDIEGRLEQIYGLLEANEQRQDLLRLIEELDAPFLYPMRDSAEELYKRIGNYEETLKELHHVYREGPESREGELEDRLHDMEEEYEHRRELLQLRVELAWAEEENEPERIRELEVEIEEFRQFMDEDQQESRRPAEPEPDMSSLPAKVVPTEEEIAAVAVASFDTEILPVLKQSCYGCHDAASASGDLDLEHLVSTRPFVQNRTHWLNIKEQMAVRSMPPAEEEQPSEEARRKVVAWLTSSIVRFDYESVRQPGHEPTRRLTHEEYNNTVRDLFGIDIKPASAFPADMSASSGFDNSANSLFFQPLLLERYLGAAEVIVDTALPARPATAAQQAAWRKLSGSVLKSTPDAPLESDLHAFLERAFRHPLTISESKPYLEQVKESMANGSSSQDAIRGMIRTALVSPEFLLKSERKPAGNGTSFPISDWELASRLSYFLWASMPDDELFKLARSGQLHNPPVLQTQVNRMLQDPRSDSLGKLFASQWLRVSEIDRVQRDQIDNPWATDSLVAAMASETAMLFNHIVRNDRPVEELISADYTFVNDELARHYRMPGISGSEMRLVSLKDSPRRGLLGHGSVLAVTSFPHRTSPVVRGNWILTELLGTPPPPPPPNVSEFDERVAENDRLSQRQKLERHRRNPNCYACHSQIDPLGFALEEFAWFGQYQGRGRDSEGRLPDGTTFQGLVGLSQTIVEQRQDDLIAQISRRMLAYALGRQLEYFDEATVQDLIRATNEDNHRIRSLIHAIVTSDTFQMQQFPEDAAQARF